MGEQRNLTEDNVGVLEAVLKEMKEANPDVEYRFFEQQKEKECFECVGEDEQPTNKAIFEKLEKIELMLKQVFGGHILMNGRWTKILP